MTNQPPNTDTPQQPAEPTGDAPPPDQPEELYVPQAAAPPPKAPAPGQQDPRRQPGPHWPHQCADCKRHFAPTEVVQYRGDIVCHHCFQHGPPGMDPRKRNAILMISLAMLPILIFGGFLLYQYVLKEPIQRTLKPQTHGQTSADQPVGAPDTSTGAPTAPLDADVRPTYTIEQLDATVAQLLRAESIEFVEIPAGPGTLSDLIKVVAPHRQAWQAFAEQPRGHVTFLYADLSTWNPRPPYVDVVLTTTTDRWGELRQTLGPPQQTRPVEHVDKPISSLTLVSDESTTPLHALTATTWVRYGYLELVLSGDNPRAYVRGVRIHVEPFLATHVPASSSNANP